MSNTPFTLDLLLKRLDQQEAVNQELVLMNRELVALLRTMTSTQESHSQQLATIAQWIERQQPAR